MTRRHFESGHSVEAVPCGSITAMQQTVVDRLRERARSVPLNPAVIDGDTTRTYAELFERADRLAFAFAAMGLRQGDAVMAFLPNSGEAIECELAALGTGLSWITLTARLTWPEVRGVVASCSPKVLITAAEGAAKIAAGLRELPLRPLPRIVVVAGAATEHPSLGAVIDYEALLASAEARAPRVHIDEEDVARLRYTSGTTGNAKAAILPHRVYHASLDKLLAELGPFTESDRALHVAPLTHGSGALVHPVLFGGGANVLLRHFDVDAVLAAIERHRITVFFTVPTMLSRLVSAPSFDRYDLSSLRALIYGGAPMPEAQLAAAVRKVGPVLHQIYGMTEAPWPITMLKPADHVLDGPRLRSVGRPTLGTEVRIVDSAGGQDAGEGKVLPAGSVGEIQLRGRNVMRGYFGKDAGALEDADVLRGEWLATGDIGRKDDDGYVFIVGRKKDVIISGGFNVYAAEVETALSAHDSVLEAAVVGLPHDDLGEIVAAFVVPKPGAALTEADVDALARARLSGYKCPRRIAIVADLPKNPSGKIQKSEVRRRAGV